MLPFTEQRERERERERAGEKVVSRFGLAVRR